MAEKKESYNVQTYRSLTDAFNKIIDTTPNLPSRVGVHHICALLAWIEKSPEERQQYIEAFSLAQARSDLTNKTMYACMTEALAVTHGGKRR